MSSSSGALLRAVEAILAAEGVAPRVVDRAGVGGGCINEAQTLELDDGRRVFLKSNARPLPGMFEREAEGLAALADVGVLRVPRPLGSGITPVPFLLLEHVESGRPGRDFFERFGRLFAEHHQRSCGPRYGFEHDNYLGSTAQPNAWCGDWVTFFREHRLGHQLRLAARRGHGGAELARLGARLQDRLDDFLAEPAEAPCLLHGDLWGGNYLCDTEGAPVLIDPAAYYGRREADLAMTQLFGGFEPRFYQAYEEAWPLAPGSEERLEIYKLYHLLNHLELFGTSYLGGCLAILRRLA